VSAVYLQQFPSYLNHNCKKLSFLRTQAFIFCLPWGRPCVNHAKRCMNEKTIQCLPNPSQHTPIYLQQFPSYSNRKCKKLPFSHTAAHIFVSPGDAPATITQYVPWMERQFNACQTPRFIRFGATHERDRRTDRHCMPTYTALMHMHRAVINGDGGCRFWQPVQADSQPKSSGLVFCWRPLGAILHSSNEPGKSSNGSAMMTAP